MSQAERPSVSIVMCTRNRADALGRALDALSNMQCAHSWEALIVNNGSTDHTAEVLEAAALKDPRLKPIYVAQPGLGNARQGGWPHARANIVAFTDDDCYVAVDYVDRLLAVFDEHPAVGCVGGPVMLHDPSDYPATIDERDYAVDHAPYTFLQAGMLHGANLSFRRDALERMGGFDTRLGAGTRFKAGEDSAAAADALWLGYHARYDPRASVSHHHGRKKKDVPKLRAGYSIGRGAYYARFLLRPDSRKTYLAGWWRITGLYRRPHDLPNLVREISSAFSYAREVGALRSALLLLPLAPVLLAYRTCTIWLKALSYVASRAITGAPLRSPNARTN